MRYPFFLLSLILGCCISCRQENSPLTQTSSAITVKLDEGTNMALALSPDKSTIVFDLQGRLWTIPVEGGNATAITDALGGSHAPHWSPNGEWIAFHSYRDGNFHIWRVKADGTGLEQLTKGLFDHREAFWKDDQTLLFASDRDGSYDIFQMDLESRKITALTSNAPDNEYYPSTDEAGRWAYVSNNTHLHIGSSNASATHQLFSSNSTLGAPVIAPGGAYIVVQGLWETHTYWLKISLDGTVDTLSCNSEDIFLFRPAFLNEDEMLYTADGKIQKLDLQSGTSTIIPFEAEVELDRQSYSRRSYDFDGKEQHKLLGIRNPVISPDGQSVIFTALGDLWLRRAEGELVQLTDDPFVDIDPNFSRDGRFIAYCSDKGGSMDIWIMDLASFQKRQLTNIGADLMYPVWSPDNSEISFVQTSRLNVWGRSTLHIAKVKDGSTRKVFDQIFVPSVPQWAPDGKSIWLAGLQPNSSRFREGKTKLLRIDLQDNSFEYLPVPGKAVISTRGKNGPIWSPDGKFLALILEGQLAIQEMDDQQQAVGEPSILLEGLSDVPSWTADSKEILVLQTDQLVKLDIDGNKEILPIDLTWNSSLNEENYIIQAGRVFNGISDTYLRDQDIWIKANRIEKISSSSGSYPEGYQLIDAKDKTIMPGLFEMHVHQSEVVGEVLGRTWLAYGITSLREVGANPYDVIARKEAWESGKRPGPRQFYTGGLTDGNRVYYGLANSIISEEQLYMELERAKQLQFDLIKTYVRMPDVWQEKVVKYAHQEIGIPVSSHELYPAVSYGVDAVEHLLGTSRRGYSLKQTALQKVYDDVTDLLAQSGMSITPTLGLGRGIVPYISKDPSLLDDPLYQHFYSEQTRNSFEGFMAARQRQDLKGQLFMLSQQQAFIKELVSAGGIVTAGTDAPFLPYGWALHAELELYVDGGLSPFQALQTASYHAARSMGLGEVLGSIEVGKIADIVIVDGDPLADISDARKVDMVIKNGLQYDKQSLLQRPE